MDVLVPTHPITLDDYFSLELYDQWGNDLVTELVEGMVVVSPAPAGPHETARYELAFMLRASLPPGLRVSGGNWVVDTSPLATVRVPEIIVVTDEQARETWLRDPPVLAAEIVSPRSSAERDLVAKRRDYARAGCPHYWVLFPDRPELIRFRLDGDAYTEVGRTVGRRKVKVTEPFPVTIDLARVIV